MWDIVTGQQIINVVYVKRCDLRDCSVTRGLRMIHLQCEGVTIVDVIKDEVLPFSKQTRRKARFVVILSEIVCSFGIIHFIHICIIYFDSFVE